MEDQGIAEFCTWVIHLRMDQSFDWNHARAFLATAETGSLSAAARRLNLTQPTIGRQITALETELGVTLFERIGRRLQITDAGRDLLTHVRHMQVGADRMALTAVGQSQSVEGTIRITASDIFSAQLLPDILFELRQIAPRLKIDLLATNSIADLMRREADIALRHVRPTEPDLFARLVMDTPVSFYASQSYLDARGAPQTLEDMSDHDFIGYGNDPLMIERLAEYGINLTTDNFKVGSENGLVAWELLRRGLGIAPITDMIGQTTPGVERLLPKVKPFTIPIWLVTHRELHTSRRIRLAFDLIAEHLGKLKGGHPRD